MIMVDPSEAASLLQQLVRIPSVNPRAGDAPGEREVAAFVASWLEARGIPTRLDEVLPGRPNVIATLPGRDPTRSLLLESHMDTVEVDGMEVEPFGGQIDGGRLYGRGACDAKGPLAAFMLAVGYLAKTGVRPPVSVTLAAVVDEEYKYRGISSLLEKHDRFAGAIVGEPTELDLVVAHKGCVRFQIVTIGTSTVSSMPWKGDNAIYRMVEVIDHIRRDLASEIEAKHHPLVGPGTFCVTLIKGGVGVNIIPEECTIDVDCRTLPGESPMEVWRELKGRFENLMPGHVQVREPYIVDYALESNPNSPIVEALRAELRRLGRNPQEVGAPYGTDASKIALRGIPAVVFGPGFIGHAHTTREFIDLAELQTAAQAVTNLLERFGSSTL